MKYLLFSLFILISCQPYSQVERVPLVKEPYTKDFKGDIKKIIEYNCDKYSPNHSSVHIIRESCKIRSIREYSKDGILLSELKWPRLNYPLEPETIIQTTNDLGLVVLKHTKLNYYFYEEKKTFSYNNNGFITEEILQFRSYPNDDFVLKRTETTYDDYNCPIKIMVFDNNNNVIYSYTSEFDNWNRETLTKRFDDANILEEYTEYKYQNGDNNWIERITYDGNKKLLKKEKFNDLHSNIEYHSNGKVKIIEQHNGIILAYDENGKNIERKTFNNKEWESTETWKFREDGVLIEESISANNFTGKDFYKITTYYRIDFFGNWHEKYTIDSEGEIANLSIRDIEYYNY